jgi:senataxin
MAEEAEFGRSLFERLVLLGYERLMLNVQYRMHPSISLFPSKEFYDQKLFDGPLVTQVNHNKRFLQEKMYASYSFINISKGKEQSNRGQSLKNIIEASAICKIISSLYKGEFLFLFFFFFAADECVNYVLYSQFSNKETFSYRIYHATFIT